VLNASDESSLGLLDGLQHIDLYVNALTGPVPKWLLNLSSLNYVDFNRNQLTGTVPAELGALTGLVIMDFNRNQLTGTVPTELGALTELTELNFGGNQLTGTVPALPFKQYTRECCLSPNNFTCPLPADYGDCRCNGAPGVACAPGGCRTTHHDGTAKSMIGVPWSDPLAGDFVLEVEVSDVNFGTSGCCFPIMSRRTKPLNETAGNKDAQFNLQILNTLINHPPHSLNLFMGNGQDGQYGAIYTSQTVPFSSWTKIKITMVSSVSTMFINGTKVASGTFSGPRLSTANPIYLGGYYNSESGHQYYHGLMRNAMVNGKCLVH
jgi:hypothetical protein